MDRAGPENTGHGLDQETPDQSGARTTKIRTPDGHDHELSENERISPSRTLLE